MILDDVNLRTIRLGRSEYHISIQRNERDMVERIPTHMHLEERFVNEIYGIITISYMRMGGGGGGVPDRPIS